MIRKPELTKRNDQGGALGELTAGRINIVVITDPYRVLERFFLN